jgi:hypothetical protein
MKSIAYYFFHRLLYGSWIGECMETCDNTCSSGGAEKNYSWGKLSRLEVKKMQIHTTIIQLSQTVAKNG